MNFIVHLRCFFVSHFYEKYDICIVKPSESARKMKKNDDGSFFCTYERARVKVLI